MTSQEVEVRPDADGIIAVQHDLGVMDAGVRCYDEARNPVPYRYLVIIGPGELEVVVAPGSGVTTVVVQAST